MAKSSKKKTADDPNERVISENRKALHNYRCWTPWSAA